MLLLLQFSLQQMCVIHDFKRVCVCPCVTAGMEWPFRKGEGLFYKDSNSSILCLVLPCRICRRVLYLSRPARTFSLWRRSFWVFLDSSRAWASSEVRAWGGRQRRGGRRGGMRGNLEQTQLLIRIISILCNCNDPSLCASLPRSLLTMSPPRGGLLVSKKFILDTCESLSCCAISLWAESSADATKYKTHLQQVWDVLINFM